MLEVFQPLVNNESKASGLEVNWSKTKDQYTGPVLDQTVTAATDVKCLLVSILQCPLGMLKVQNFFLIREIFFPGLDENSRPRDDDVTPC